LKVSRERNAFLVSNALYLPSSMKPPDTFLAHHHVCSHYLPKSILRSAPKYSQFQHLRLEIYQPYLLNDDSTLPYQFSFLMPRFLDLIMGNSMFSVSGVALVMGGFVFQHSFNMIRMQYHLLTASIPFPFYYPTFIGF